jgi:glucose-1-phosphate cytidylyltransferase
MKAQIHPSSVPVLILAGGLGTRLAEETTLRPKPMVEIGGIPILLHVMRYYYSFGFNDFVICAGHLSHMIKDYFSRYELIANHIEIDHRINPASQPKIFGHSAGQEKWRVRVIETGAEAMTGARVARALDTIACADGRVPECFGLTYGDGLTNTDLLSELSFHGQHGKIGTVLGVKPVARFGELAINEDLTVAGFVEKPASRHSYMNGGFFFFNGQFRKYLSAQASCVLEKEPLEKLSADGELKMWANLDFWQCMDNLRDKMYLQELWDSSSCPWRRIPSSKQEPVSDSTFAVAANAD